MGNEEKKISETESEEKVEEAVEKAVEATEKDDESSEKTEESSEKTDETSEKHDEPYVDVAAFETVKKKKHIFRKIMIALGVIVVIAYGVMVYLSYKYFAPGTCINGKDYSFKSYDEVLEDVNKAYDDYKLDIRFRNGYETFNKDQAGLKVTAERDIKKIKKKQNPFLWFTYLWSDNETAGFEFSVDKDALMDSIEKSEYLSPAKMKEPEEPSIVFNEKEGRVEIIEGDEGTLLDKFSVFLLCYKAVENRDGYVDIRNSDCYIKPKFFADSPRLVNTADRINHYLSAKITYLYGDLKIELSPENIYNILSISDDYSVYLSPEKVKDFVRNLSYEYDTYDTYRSIKTHNGKIFKVNSDEYGYQIDIDKEASLLYINISGGETVEREPEFLHTGYRYTKKKDDISGNYVEVDLSNQMIYLYSEGKIILESEVVSGDMKLGHGTPGGLYDVDGMYYDVVLTGDDYASPVKYWMPFNGGIGMHDATWRSYFGGDIYVSNGSHGCVNLPFDVAKEIYNTIEPGYPVVLYWEDELSK